jgi:SAM-dependent methyltransferase
VSDGLSNAAELFGADRVYPDGSFMFQCHLFGYMDLAARLPERARVLDLACGEGYGAAVLAARGHTVVGVDLEAPVLQDAATRYRAATFTAGDALRLPFADATFDAIGALQVIEHLPDEFTDPMLVEIARVLKPGGLLYVTTPNIDKLPATASKEFNPHHFRDFNPATLEAVLRRRFTDVTLFGQMLDESLERVQRLFKAAEREWALIGRVERVERRVRFLPGPLRVRARRWLLRAAGIPRWPLPEGDAARDEIRAEDFRAAPPATESGNIIAIARR